MKSNIEELQHIFCYNIIDYYQNRPDCLLGIISVSFATNAIAQKKHDRIDDNINNDDNNEDKDHIAEEKLLIKNNIGYLNSGGRFQW